MEKLYYNALEQIIEDIYDKYRDDFNCCHCALCRASILAYALTRTKPQYVVSSKGALFAKLANLSPQRHSDIITILVKASKIVSDNPRHESNT